MSKQIEQHARIGKIFARWHLTIAITSNILIFILIFYFILFFIFPSLLLGISACYSAREQFYLSGITSLFFLSVVFSLRTKRVTSQHNL